MIFCSLLLYNTGTNINVCEQNIVWHAMYRIPYNFSSNKHERNIRYEHT